MQQENRESPPPTTGAGALAFVGTIAIVGMIALVFGTAIWFTSRAEGTPPKVPPAPTGVEAPSTADLAPKLRDSYRAAADWLVRQQTPEGAWSAGPVPSPAYTALILTALREAPPELRTAYQAPIDKALAWLATTQNADGSFSEQGGLMKSYVTGVVLSALGPDAAKHKEAIARAHDWARKNVATVGFAVGGFGYGDKGISSKTGEIETKEANISTTNVLVDGLEASGFPEDDPLRDLVVQFAKANQNSSESNVNPEVVKALRDAGYTVGDDGGFVYNVITSKAAADPTSPDVLRSYGAMSYAGLKIYLFGGLQKDDPAVKAAIQYVRKTFSVDKHPGFEFDQSKRADLQGIFYYYLTMTRALDAWGENPLALAGGKTIDWPRALGAKLLSLQKDARWVNENPRWWEDQDVMVTAYVLNIYNVLLKHIR